MNCRVMVRLWSTLRLGQLITAMWETMPSIAGLFDILMKKQNAPFLIAVVRLVAFLNFRMLTKI